MTKLNPLAEGLNEQLKGTALLSSLSAYGKRLYFPKGIIAQSGEAAARADRVNATIGTARENGLLMGFDLTGQPISTGLGISNADIFNYAPTAGLPELRKIWLREMRIKNPGLSHDEGTTPSTLPAVVPGLTAGLVLTSELFFDAGDALLVPDIHWGNYDLAFGVHHQLNLGFYPLFKEGATADMTSPMDIDGIAACLKEHRGKKVGIIFNFPNNFSGYSPSRDEAVQIAEVLKAEAEHGTRIVAITDDAYFGLFFEQETNDESLFSRFAELHNNIVAVKVDGATKEEAAWGMRVAFVTIANPELSDEQLRALEQKVMGAIRAAYSNSPRLSQALILRALDHKDYPEQKQHLFDTLKERYEIVRELCKDAPSGLLEPLPFNSGYFMAFRCSVASEDLRLLLLERGIGTIAIAGKYLRVAFSSVDTGDLKVLFEEIYQAARELADKK